MAILWHWSHCEPAVLTLQPQYQHCYRWHASCYKVKWLSCIFLRFGIVAKIARLTDRQTVSERKKDWDVNKTLPAISDHVMAYPCIMYWNSYHQALSVQVSERRCQTRVNPHSIVHDCCLLPEYSISCGLQAPGTDGIRVVDLLGRRFCRLVLAFSRFCKIWFN